MPLIPAACVEQTGTGMGREETVLEMAHRFLFEINEGEMDRALDDGLILLRLMSGNHGGLNATTMVLPTPPPRKADKNQVAPSAGRACQSLSR